MFLAPETAPARLLNAPKAIVAKSHVMHLEHLTGCTSEVTPGISCSQSFRGTVLSSEWKTHRRDPVVPVGMNLCGSNLRALAKSKAYTFPQVQLAHH